MKGRAGERGQVDVYAVLLFPMLMLVLALVLAVGTMQGLRTRLRAQLDMAALVATQALDPAALASGEPPRLQVAAPSLRNDGTMQPLRLPHLRPCV